METAPSFELNRAIQDWRADLAQSPALRADNLDELEAHLRDSIAGLSGKGLSDEEMFLVAVRRCGSRKQLQGEYSKPTLFETWFFRLVWLFIGLLAALNIAAYRFGKGDGAPEALFVDPFDTSVSVVLLLFVAIAAGNACLLRRANPRLSRPGPRVGLYWLVVAIFAASLALACGATFQMFCGAWLSELNAAPFGNEKILSAVPMSFAFGVSQIVILLWLLSDRARAGFNGSGRAKSIAFKHAN